MPKPPTEDSVLLKTVELVNEQGATKAAELLQISPSAVYNRLKAAAARKLIGPKAITRAYQPRKSTVELDANELAIIEKFRESGILPNIVKSDMHNAKMAANNKSLQYKYDLLTEELTATQEKLDLYQVVGEEKPTDYHYTVKARHKDSESVAFMVASDWHVEERVDSNTVNEYNEYTPEIAKSRSEKFFQNGLKLINIQRNGTKIDELCLCLLGDFISGYIHDELMVNNFLSPTEAIMLAQNLMYSGINFLLKEGKFKKIKIICSVGNHGRITKKTFISSRHSSNYEPLIYNFLKDKYSDNSAIEIISEKGYHTYLNVYDNFIIRFHHGDDMKFGGGVGGITIPVRKAIAQWNIIKRVNLDVFGHFHQFMDGGDFICNGSLIGTNAYAIAIKASCEKPRQAFFLIEKDHGKTIVAPIRVN